MIAYLTILVLGASFSLVPASLWPSVPKLVDAKIIGSAYAPVSYTHLDVYKRQVRTMK